MDNTDIKSYPWYILVDDENREVVENWLEQYYPGFMRVTGTVVYTNIYDGTDQQVDIVLHGHGVELNPLAKEIKITCKKVIDKVIYPELESETEKQIRELKETIDKAQKQIEQLQGQLK